MGKLAKDDEPASRQPTTNEKYSLDTQCLSKRNILIDILPSVYQIIHPNVRETNILLFTDWERTVFLVALEFMVVFNIKLRIGDQYGPVEDLGNLEGGAPRFEPDLPSLVVFGSAVPSHLLDYHQRGRPGFGHASQSKSRTKDGRLPMRHQA